MVVHRQPVAWESSPLKLDLPSSTVTNAAPSRSGAERFVSADGRLSPVDDGRFFGVASSRFSVEDRFSAVEDSLLQAGRRWLKMLGCLHRPLLRLLLLLYFF